MEERTYENNYGEYKAKMREKMEALEMNIEEYQTFLLQGIKKEVIMMRRILEEKKQ